MSSVLKHVELDAAEIGAPDVDSLLSGTHVLGRHDGAADDCNHDRIKFVPGTGFQCAHCAADVADLD